MPRFAYPDRIFARIDADGNWSDGADHRREGGGFCVVCGASAWERHYRVVRP